MKKMINTESIVGRIYQSDLEIKTVQNKESQNYGKEFINGTLEVVIDEDGLNVIPVHFSYVTEFNSKDQPNRTYSTLKKIIEENKTWVTVGKDEATMVKVDTALALNDFYDQTGTLVSAKRNEGGFVTIINDFGAEGTKGTFNMDMLITNVIRKEADPEKNIDEHAIVKGAIFDFRNAILPVEFIVKKPEGMDYFESLEASNANPTFTRVWGDIVCETSIITKEEESAFGEPAIRTYERKSKNWVITGTAKVVYDFGAEEVLTVNDIKKALQDREMYLAEVKKRNDEYKASRNGTTSVIPQSNPATVVGSTPSTMAKTSGTFNF